MKKHRSSNNPPDEFVKKADRLKSVIDKLEDSLYSINERDPRLRYEYLKTYRVEILRGFVVHMHLATEDLLKAILFDFFVRQNKRLTTKETKRIVDEMRSFELIQWCGRLNLITTLQYRQLLELNRVRNGSAHHWILDLPKYKRVMMKNAKRRIRVPVVVYNNKNLFNSRVFADEFCPTYGSLYLKLLWKVWKMQGKL
jgi:hypothetical protein